MSKVIILLAEPDLVIVDGKTSKIQSEQIETYTTLTKLCKAHPEFSYSYLKGKKFPFTYKGYEFIKKEL